MRSCTKNITSYGHGCWRKVPEQAGLQRCGKSCRLRWLNYLRPDIKRGGFTQDEEKLIIKLHGVVGNRWAHIAKSLPRRTDNEIKSYWNSWIKKKLEKPYEDDDHQQHSQMARLNSNDQYHHVNQTYIARPYANPPCMFEPASLDESNTHANKIDMNSNNLVAWILDQHNATPIPNMDMDASLLMPTLMGTSATASKSYNANMDEMECLESSQDLNEVIGAFGGSVEEQRGGGEIARSSSSSMMSSSFPSCLGDIMMAPR